MNYKGTLIDGKEFDNSYTRGEPSFFPSGRCYPGLDRRSENIKKGGKIELVIPPTNWLTAKRVFRGSHRILPCVLRRAAGCETSAEG
ncbi:FKBP-type peptidyl-prolyl cis-trans isomerase [Escherichia coli]